MEEKIIQFINYINANQPISQGCVAKEFDVTKRSVRNYAIKANHILIGAASIQLKPSKGYVIDVVDEVQFENLLNTFNQSIALSVPSEPLNRVNYLLNDLLNRTDWVTIGSLASLLYVSDKTVSADLKEVETVLNDYDLVLKRKPYYGIRVLGSELNKRICLAQLVITNQENLSPFDKNKLEKISQCVKNCIKGTNVHISSVALHNLVIHIFVSLARIENDEAMPMPTEHIEIDEDSEEYKIAESIVSSIEEEFGLKVDNDEIKYTALHIASKETLLKITQDSCSYVIDDEIWLEVNEMIEVIWDVFKFDLRNDLELHMNLAKHLIPLKMRLKFGMNANNPLLNEIKTDFPLPYLMAVETSLVLARKFKKQLPDEEIGYIALNIALALERQQTSLPEKRLLIVCASGTTSAQLLKRQCEVEFNGYVKDVQTCDIKDFKHIDLSKFDYVFTTVPLDTTPPIPVRQVGLLLRGEDITKTIDELGSVGDQFLFTKYFDKDLFFGHVKADNKEQILRKLSSELVSWVDADFDLYDLVQQREDIAATSFGRGFAIPHNVTPIGDETKVACCVLDEPVLWDEELVSVVFMTLVGTPDNNDDEAFTKAFAKFLLNDSNIETIKSSQNFEMLKKLFNESVKK